MALHEPATFVTDLLLCALAAWLAARLRRRAAPGCQAARWWSGALACTAAAAFVGGAYHGFAPNFPAVAGAWWRLTLLLVGLTGATMALALVHEVAPPTRHGRWVAVVAAKFAALVGAIAIEPRFLFALVDYGLVMLAWVAAAVLAPRPWRAPMLLGVGFSAAGGAVQQFGWGFGPHFNHNDLYHVIQAAALVAFYKAGRRLSGAGGPAGHS